MTQWADSVHWKICSNLEVNYIKKTFFSPLKIPVSSVKHHFIISVHVENHFTQKTNSGLKTKLHKSNLTDELSEFSSSKPPSVAFAEIGRELYKLLPSVTL